MPERDPAEMSPIQESYQGFGLDRDPTRKPDDPHSPFVALSRLAVIVGGVVVVVGIYGGIRAFALFQDPLTRFNPAYAASLVYYIQMAVGAFLGGPMLMWFGFLGEVLIDIRNAVCTPGRLVR